MTSDKLNKYKKGNFELKSKHIYAKKKLENIRDYILLSHNLVGGAVPDQITEMIINPKKNDYDDDDEINIDHKSDKSDKVKYFQNLQEKIKTEMKTEKNVKLLIKSDNVQFKNIMEADEDIVKVFDDFINLSNMGNEKKGEVGKLLFNIQKSLFNLQAKIIFSSLKKVDDIDVKPLLNVIEQKINAMNDYIDKQEKLFNETTNDENSEDKITYQKLDYNKKKGPGQGQGQGQGQDKGPGQDKDPGQGQDKGPGQGQDKGPGQGQDKGPGQGQDKGPGQGQDEDQTAENIINNLPQENKNEIIEKLLALLDKNKLNADNIDNDEKFANTKIDDDKKDEIINNIKEINVNLINLYDKGKKEHLKLNNKTDNEMTNQDMADILQDITQNI
jgi:hypothetical protein